MSAILESISLGLRHIYEPLEFYAELGSNISLPRIQIFFVWCWNSTRLKVVQQAEHIPK